MQETVFRVDKLPATDEMVHVWAKLTGLAGAGFKQDKDKTNVTQHPNGKDPFTLSNYELQRESKIFV